MHIVIENVVALNAGDAAILIAIMKIMRETFGPETYFSVFDSSPEISKQYYPDINFYPLTTSLIAGPALIRIGGSEWKAPFQRKMARLRRKIFWRRVNSAASGKKLRPSILLDNRVLANLDIYRSADIIVSTGGTYLVEHYNFNPRLVEFKKDIALHKPLVLFTQSLGPFAKPPNREALKEIGEQASLILLRDEKSEQNLRDLGIAQDKMKVIADGVFALADIERLSSSAHYTASKTPKIAISVREWSHFDGLPSAIGMQRYEESIAAAVSAMVRENDAQIEFISTCQGIREYAFDDSIVAHRIYEGLDADVKRAVDVDGAFHSPTELMEKLKGFDFVISTRMHMAILAMCVGVPVLPIAYEFKTRELYKSLNQEHWVTDISWIDKDAFVELVRRFSISLDRFQDSVVPYIVDQAQSARSAGRLIARSVGAGARC